jgi:NAD(P)-dependent dehydrogenase (short-subunit alcohol dehydrogenase family)
MVEKIVLVTGGATGIGRATALLLAAEGNVVVVSGRRKDVGNQLVEKIRAGGGKAEFIASDITEEEAVRTLIHSIVEKYGRLDCAVNNAGILNEMSLLADSETVKFQTMIQTNIVGVYLSMKYEIQEMLKTGGGAIVNLAAYPGIRGLGFTSAYSATKHAVVGLTRSGALDYATQNIRINAVAPGGIETALLDRLVEMSPLDHTGIAAMHPMQRVGKPEEIAPAIVWLLSDKASFMTGEIVNIDGGLTA